MLQETVIVEELGVEGTGIWSAEVILRLVEVEIPRLATSSWSLMKFDELGVPEFEGLELE